LCFGLEAWDPSDRSFFWNDEPAGWKFVRSDCEFTRRSSGGQFSKFGAERKVGEREFSWHAKFDVLGSPLLARVLSDPTMAGGGAHPTWLSCAGLIIHMSSTGNAETDWESLEVSSLQDSLSLLLFPGISMPGFPVTPLRGCGVVSLCFGHVALSVGETA